MQLEDLVKDRIANVLSTKKLSDNPSNIKYSFVGNYDEIRLRQLDECNAWLSGDANQLLNIYSAKSVFGYVSEPIYNRNKQNLYWSISSQEGNIKRTHSSFIRDMIYTMASKVGYPLITSKDPIIARRLQKMIKASDFYNLVVQTIIPQTLSGGTDVLKPCFDKRIAPVTIPQVYKADDIRIITAGNIVVGVLFLDYYQDSKGTDYVLCEVRYRSYDKSKDIKNGLPYENGYMSVIESVLCRKDKNDLTIVPINTLPETAGIMEDPLIIFGLDKPLCQVIEFYKDNEYPDYGASIIVPKIDLADDLDQALSQQSTTTRRSTPQEYINGEYLEKDANGRPIPMASFDRSFMMLDYPITNGDGTVANAKAVETSQPNLNIEQYSSEIENLKAEICGHFISPSTMGIGMSKKDNGDAQREKEKITTSTRKHIIEVLTNDLIEYFTMALQIDDYMTGDQKSFDFDKTYDISISFDELNAPTTEGKITTFMPMFTANAISEELFVDRVWGNSLSEEQRNKEIQFLKDSRKEKSNTPTKESQSPTPKDDSRKQMDMEEGIQTDSQSYAGRPIHSTKKKPE